MEIAAQRDSNGIVYEGYHDEFKQCIFEDGEIQGKNERYEFRCDSHLECCGRVCCVPGEAGIPLWLLILFIALGLLALLSLLACLAYWCAKRKPKPKPKRDLYQSSTGYRSIRHADDDGGRHHGSYGNIEDGWERRSVDEDRRIVERPTANTALAHRMERENPYKFHEEETIEESYKEEIEVDGGSIVSSEEGLL